MHVSKEHLKINKQEADRKEVLLHSSQSLTQDVAGGQ
jgi:hypothetical protein